MIALAEAGSIGTPAIRDDLGPGVFPGPRYRRGDIDRWLDRRPPPGGRESRKPRRRRGPFRGLRVFP
jgi:hypothetical protein